jgi:polar amino acid transport system substrate-binding protein
MDRRTYLRTVGAAGLATGLAGCLGGLGGGGDEITPATAPGFPPFEMVEGGELVGFDVDLLKAVVEETSFTLGEWEQLEFDSLIPALTSENIDVIAAAMTITEERDQTIDFTDPYYSSDQSIVVRAGEGGQYGELSDLSDQQIGAQSGTTGEGVVQDELIANGHIAENQYRAFDNYVLAVQALENGDVDAVVIDQPVGATFADQRDVEVAFVYETGEEFGFGVREDDDDLRTGLNDGLAAVRDSGEYTEITNTWFGQG